MWDVQDVGCSGYGMFGMWDVRDVGCGMLIYKMPIERLLVLRNIKRYKVMIRENFIILIKRKKKFSNTLHIATDDEFIFPELVIHKTLK